MKALCESFTLCFASASYFWTHDAHRFLSILVTATPCPLLVAIPITIISAISKAAKNSIIMKEPSVLEELPLRQTAIFDKTGTLTLGKPELTKIYLLSHYSNLEILQYTASLERYSKHPLAQALLDAALSNYPSSSSC